MADENRTLIERLRSRFDGKAAALIESHGATTMELAPEHWLEACRALRDEPEFHFEQLVDLCGVDYLGYGRSEWEVADVTSEGYSRGVHPDSVGWLRHGDVRADGTPAPRRFAVVVHLLSYKHNQRLRLRCWCTDESLPLVPSLVAVWPGVNWFEREAFDLYGIVFEGHPDLRRILTDYGFVGHPFRKDFPLIGNVEVRYDPERQRVIYQPVTIEPRVLVPRVIREDSRYQQAQAEQQSTPRQD